MNREDHGRVNTGIALFIGLTFLGSWCMAAVLRLSGATVAPEPLGTRLFTTSLLYALTMGWQPIVATWFVRRWVDPPDGLDLGLRSAGRGFGLVGGAGAIAVAVAATGVATLLTRWGVADVSTSMNGTAELELSSATPSVSGALALFAAFGATILLVWLQCFAKRSAGAGTSYRVSWSGSVPGGASSSTALSGASGTPRFCFSRDTSNSPRSVRWAEVSHLS